MNRAVDFARRLLDRAAEIQGVSEFVPIEMAHINSCHYSGRLSLDFAEFLLAEGATMAVPTHTNASLVSAARPDLRAEAEDPEMVAGARRVMEIYEELGCSPMWTCAPYHDSECRPGLGQHIVGSESNAVSFFNSVLGARTNKYGDVIDMAGAIIGEVPKAGLHTDEGRLATHLFRVELPDAWSSDRSLPHLLGIIVGRQTGSHVPVIDGWEPRDETDLKAVAAAGASSGGVGLFHVVGATPEAATLTDATGGRQVQRKTTIDASAIERAGSALSTGRTGPVSAVCLGTPHFSIDEFGDLLETLGDRRAASHVRVIVTTSRAVAAELGLRGWARRLEDAGIDVVTDTCSYYRPRPTGVDGLVVTNSAKWAYYAPGMLDVDVAFTDLRGAVDAAVTGEVIS